MTAGNSRSANGKGKAVENITEEQHVHDAWYEAKPQTPEELAEFARHVLEDYGHDYGTICHAVASIALAGANLGSHVGGITGFQAGAVMWEFISHWKPLEGPAMLVDYEWLLYPQYEEKFERTISPETWEWAQDEARKHLGQLGKDSLVAGAVAEHWAKIANGEVPFGLTVRKAA